MDSTKNNIQQVSVVCKFMLCPTMRMEVNASDFQQQQLKSRKNMQSWLELMDGQNKIDTRRQ